MKERDEAEALAETVESLRHDLATASDCINGVRILLQERFGREVDLPFLDDCVTVALSLAEAAARQAGAEEMRERAARLHESIDNDCDRDRIRDPHLPVCGCGAMGAVIEYRDAIRALPLDSGVTGKPKP